MKWKEGGEEKDVISELSAFTRAILRDAEITRMIARLRVEKTEIRCQTIIHWDKERKKMV